MAPLLTLGDALGVHYTSTKHAIRGLTKSLALALGPNGIRVNAITSGPTLTSQALQARSPEELLDRGRELPLGRIGQPDDVAAVVSFLLVGRRSIYYRSNHTC
jgi:3-oxoacyl-[acyl-carrier protein] reductase